MNIQQPTSTFIS